MIIIFDVLQGEIKVNDCWVLLLVNFPIGGHGHVKLHGCIRFEPSTRHDQIDQVNVKNFLHLPCYKKISVN
jgi:hypothetical protein